MEHPHEIEIFYDGDCPLCKREMALLERRDKKQRIRFTNIAAPDFDPESLGLPISQLMDRIHARLADGTWIQGVEVFRRVYGAVGLGWLVAPTRWPGLRQLSDFAYRVFAKNRMRFTGRMLVATPSSLQQCPRVRSHRAGQTIALDAKFAAPSRPVTTIKAFSEGFSSHPQRFHALPRPCP